MTVHAVTPLGGQGARVMVRPMAPGTVVVLGLDPGVTTGIGLITPGGQPLAFQCNAAGAYPLTEFLIEASEGPATVILAGERFIAGRGPGARGGHAAITRQVIEDVSGLGAWTWRSAAEVKPWATDQRLAAAGLLAPCQGMPHAADGMRHALFAAVQAGVLADPLSRAPRVRVLKGDELT